MSRFCYYIMWGHKKKVGKPGMHNSSFIRIRSLILHILFYIVYNQGATIFILNWESAEMILIVKSKVGSANFTVVFFYSTLSCLWASTHVWHNVPRKKKHFKDDKVIIIIINKKNCGQNHCHVTIGFVVYHFETMSSGLWSSPSRLL